MNELLRLYVVTLMRIDGAATTSTREIWSYSAADVVTELDIELRSSIPGVSVYRVRPLGAPPHRHLKEDES